MHKPRLSFNLNKIIQKEKKKKKESFTKFALSLTFHYPDTFFLYFWKTFKWKYNFLKHTIFSHKYNWRCIKEKFRAEQTKQCLLQALIDKSFPSGNSQLKMWDKLFWNFPKFEQKVTYLLGKNSLNFGFAGEEVNHILLLL